MADSIEGILLGLVIIETAILFGLWINQMVSRREQKRDNKVRKKINLEKIIMAINGCFWLGLGVYFLLVALFAFPYPQSFSKYEIGLVFTGIGLSCLGMLYYWVDKLNDLKKNDKLDKRLERIEEILKKI